MDSEKEIRHWRKRRFGVILKKDPIPVQKEVKHFAKRSKEGKLLEIMEKNKRDEENTREDIVSLQRSRKIKVNLTEDQKKLFQKWSHVYCWCYNRALEIVKAKQKDFKTWEDLKMYMLDEERLSETTKEEQEMLGPYTPYDLKTASIHEMFSKWGSTMESLGTRIQTT